MAVGGGELPAGFSAASWPGELPAKSVVVSHPGVDQGRSTTAGSCAGKLPARHAAGSWPCGLPAGCVESRLAGDVRENTQFIWRTDCTLAPGGRPKAAKCSQFRLRTVIFFGCEQLPWETASKKRCWQLALWTDCRHGANVPSRGLYVTFDQTSPGNPGACTRWWSNRT